MQIKINQTLYNIRDGYNVKKEYNETLDSAVVVFTTETALDIHPFDKVYVLSNEIGELIFLVDNYVENIVQFTPNKVYEYTLNLFSETKALERITLPSLTITKTNPAKSVLYYFNNYCINYLPKIRVANPNGTGWNFTSKYTIDSALQTKLSTIECPEFQWNDSTMREVLNDLLSTIDALVVVRDNVITYYDVTELGSAIDETKLNNTQVTRGSADYASELTITMKNAVGNNNVRYVDYASFRNESDGELTTNNLQIVLQRPIYDIIKVNLGYFLAINDGGGGTIYKYFEVDITNNIKEKSAWDVLTPTTLLPADQTRQRIATHKQLNAYYTRGSNIIEGFGLTYQGAVVGIYDALTSIARSAGGILPGSAIYNDLRDVFVKVEYESLDDKKVDAGKYLKIKNQGIKVFDAQENSYVDIKQLGIYEYAKVNRLSNKILTIYANYYNAQDIPNLGDYIGNNILFSIELEVFKGVVRFKGMLTEHYVLQQWFTALKSVKRSWALAQRNEALTRYDLKKVYAELSFTRKDENFTFERPNVAQYFLSPFIYRINDKSIKKSIMRHTFFGGFAPDVSLGVGYEIDCDTDVVGNSLLFTSGYIDNIVVGNFIQLDGLRYKNNLYKYTNNEGENLATSIKYCDFVSPTGSTLNTFPEKYDDVIQIQMDGNINRARLKPIVTSLTGTNVNFETYLPIFKDNREITKISTQVEFCSDTQDIIIGREFLENQQAFKSNYDLSSYTIKNLYDLTIRTSVPTTADYFDYLRQWNDYRDMGVTSPDNKTGKLVRVETAPGVFELRIYYPVDLGGGNYGWGDYEIATTAYVYSIPKNNQKEYYFMDPANTFYQEKTNIYKLYTSSTQTYNVNDKQAKGSYLTTASYTITSLTTNTAKFELLNSFSSNVVSWAITDENDNLIIAVNGGLSKRVFYLNLLLTRDDNVYNNIYQQQVLGDMQQGTYVIPAYTNPNLIVIRRTILPANKVII